MILGFIISTLFRFDIHAEDNLHTFFLEHATASWTNRPRSGEDTAVLFQRHHLFLTFYATYKVLMQSYDYYQWYNIVLII